jgi:hypothetical protein
VLTDHFMWVSGLGWMTWDGRRWAAATEVEVTEAVRGYALDQFNEAVNLMRGWATRQPQDRRRLAFHVVGRADEVGVEPCTRHRGAES